MRVGTFASGVLSVVFCCAPLFGCAQTPVEGSVDKALPPGAQPAAVAASESLAPEAQTTAAPLAACTPESMSTRQPGVLTVAAPVTEVPPWFNGAHPTSGAGLEAAIVGHSADVLGFSSVNWVGPNDAADLYVGQFTANDNHPATRTTASNPASPTFSSGYFAVHDTVVVNTDRAPRGSSLDWAAARIGYVVDAPSELTASERQARNSEGFPSEEAGLEALRSGRLDAMLIPITRALTLDNSEGLTALAQVPPLASRQADQLVMALPPNAGYAPCIDAALDRLRIEGVLEAEARRWITVPVAS